MNTVQDDLPSSDMVLKSSILMDNPKTLKVLIMVTTLVALVSNTLILTLGLIDNKVFNEKTVYTKLQHSLSISQAISAEDLTINQKNWNNYNSQTRVIRSIFETAKKTNYDSDIFNENIIAILEGIVASQAKINSKQKSFLKIRSQVDSLQFSLKKIADSVDLIISSIKQSGKEQKHLEELYMLGNQISQLKLVLKEHWLPESDHNRLQEKTKVLLMTSTTLSDQLLGTPNGLLTSIYRRELVNMIQEIEKLKISLAAFHSSLLLIPEIAKLQNQIKEAAAMLFSTPKLNKRNIVYILIFLTTTTLATILLAVYCSLKIAKHPFKTETAPMARTPASSTNEGASTSNKAISKLTQTIDETARGMLNIRADEREFETKAAAQSFNYLISNYYKKIVEIHRELQGLKNSIKQCPNPEITTKEDPKNTFNLNDVITHTFQIAAATDQLELKLKQDTSPKPCLLALTTSIDKEQSLIRVKLRDFQEHLINNKENTSQNNTNTIKTTEHIQNIEKLLGYFNLERKI